MYFITKEALCKEDWANKSPLRHSLIQPPPLCWSLHSKSPSKGECHGAELHQTNASPVQGEMPTKQSPPLCKGGCRVLAPSLPPAKGGGMPLGMTEGLFAYAADL